MANYTKKMTVGKENRTELHEKLALTGAEISLNTLPAGANVPFVHSHKANEEIYGVLSGKGKVVIDGEEISLAAGDWLKISPAAKRQFFAASNSEITYICIQVRGKFSRRLYGNGCCDLRIKPIKTKRQDTTATVMSCLCSLLFSSCTARHEKVPRPNGLAASFLVDIPRRWEPWRNLTAGACTGCAC